jgi:hypothetical protein
MVIFLLQIKGVGPCYFGSVVMYYSILLLQLLFLVGLIHIETSGCGVTVNLIHAMRIKTNGCGVTVVRFLEA